jgi:excisionase family DNA binding protein
MKPSGRQWMMPCAQLFSRPAAEQRRRLITVDETTKELGGISRTTFYTLVEERSLSMVKIGRRTFVATSELDAFVKRQRSCVKTTHDGRQGGNHRRNMFFVASRIRLRYTAACTELPTRAQGSVASL